MNMMRNEMAGMPCGHIMEIAGGLRIHMMIYRIT